MACLKLYIAFFGKLLFPVDRTERYLAAGFDVQFAVPSCTQRPHLKYITRSKRKILKYYLKIANFHYARKIVNSSSK